MTCEPVSSKWFFVTLLMPSMLKLDERSTFNWFGVKSSPGWVLIILFNDFLLFSINWVRFFEWFSSNGICS